MNIKQKGLLLFTFSLTVIFGILFFIGQYFYLYWRLPHYDTGLHLLGGIVFSCITYMLISFSRTKRSSLSLFIACLSGVLFVGITWELFELKAGITALTNPGYTLDTCTDIVADMIGGSLGALYILRRFTNK